jgi:hypothetical protein
MDTSNKLTKDALASANRSWIQINAPEDFAGIKEPSSIANLEFYGHLSNPGHSPARNILAEAAVEVLSRDKAPSFSVLADLGTRSHLAILFPGTYADHPAVIGIISHNLDGSVAQLSNQQRESLKHGQSYLALFGKVRYTDDYGTHWTQFCWWKAFIDPNQSSTETRYFNSETCVAFTNIGDY